MFGGRLKTNPHITPIMITIRNVSFHIGSNPILNNVSLDIPEGGITALIGPNGAGKSTLLSFMARLRPLEQGSISYAGKDISTTPTAELAKTLSILTQENSVMSRITVRDLLMFGRYPYHQGRPTPEDLAIVENALSEFKLDSFANRYLTELSGGQRQRAMIAMVFCQSTDYVLLDEPLNNLDMYHARALMQLLQRLTREHKRTTVVAPHAITPAATSTRPPKFNAAKLEAELRESSHRLQGVMLERLNYDAFIARYDKPTTFFYIDPPYWDCETMYGKGIFAKADFDALATQLRAIKGKFLLSINDTPEIRAIFAGFEMREVELTYSLCRSGGTAARELLIANYPINTFEAT